MLVLVLNPKAKIVLLANIMKSIYIIFLNTEHSILKIYLRKLNS